MAPGAHGLQMKHSKVARKRHHGDLVRKRRLEQVRTEMKRREQRRQLDKR